MSFTDNIKRLVDKRVDQDRTQQTQYRTLQTMAVQENVAGVVKSVNGTQVTVTINGSDTMAYASTKQVRVGQRVVVWGGQVY